MTLIAIGNVEQMKPQPETKQQIAKEILRFLAYYQDNKELGYTNFERIVPMFERLKTVESEFKYSINIGTKVHGRKTVINETISIDVSLPRYAIYRTFELRQSGELFYSLTEMFKSYLV